jgi:hypothetical protein
MPIAHRMMGFDMLLKIYLRHFYLDLSPANLGHISDKHCEWFHKDISIMEESYQEK